MVELRLSGVGKTYAGEVPLRALRDVTLTIRQGEFISIQGPSGAGKSTLLNQLALLDTPTSGDYLIDGVGVRTLGERRRAVVRSENFAFIFQSFHLLPGRSVVENVALGLLYRGLGRRRSRDPGPARPQARTDHPLPGCPLTLSRSALDSRQALCLFYTLHDVHSRQPTTRAPLIEARLRH